MNIQSTKLQLIKLIAEAQSEQLLQQLLSILKRENTPGQPAPGTDAAPPAAAMEEKEGFLVYTGEITEEGESVLNLVREEREQDLI